MRKVQVSSIAAAVSVCLDLDPGEEIEIEFDKEVGPEEVGTLEAELLRAQHQAFTCRGVHIKRNR